jgi:hypothetical protein
MPIFSLNSMTYRGADKSLARPGRKQATSMSKSSWMIDPTRSRETPRCSAIDLAEIRRSSKISSWIWSVISGVVGLRTYQHPGYYFHSRTVLHLDIIRVFYSPPVAQESWFRNIKIYIKTAPTCFVAITIIRERILKVCHPRCVVRDSKCNPVTGLEWPRGFQEVKVPRLHDNGTGWW